MSSASESSGSQKTVFSDTSSFDEGMTSIPNADRRTGSEITVLSH